MVRCWTLKRRNSNVRNSVFTQCCQSLYYQWCIRRTEGAVYVIGTNVLFIAQRLGIICSLRSVSFFLYCHKALCCRMNRTEPNHGHRHKIHHFFSPYRRCKESRCNMMVRICICVYMCVFVPPGLQKGYFKTRMMGSLHTLCIDFPH